MTNQETLEFPNYADENLERNTLPAMTDPEKAPRPYTDEFDVLIKRWVLKYENIYRRMAHKRNRAAEQELRVHLVDFEKEIGRPFRQVSLEDQKNEGN